jgi:hypothetical protein
VSNDDDESARESFWDQDTGGVEIVFRGVGEDEVRFDEDEIRRHFPWTRLRGRAAAEHIAKVTGCRLRRQGKDWTGLCPLHSETRASFFVGVGDKTGKVTVNCFGCYDCGKDGSGRWKLLQRIQDLVDGKGKFTREEMRRRADSPAFRAIGQRKGKPLRRGVEFGAASIAFNAANKPIRNLLKALEDINTMGGGKLNGRLTPTTRVLERHGVRRASIAAAIRGAEALGMLRTKRAGFNRRTWQRGITTYRLTYIPAWNAPYPTDEWRAFEPKAKGARAWKETLRVARDILKQLRDGPKSASKVGAENGPKTRPYKNAKVVALEPPEPPSGERGAEGKAEGGEAKGRPEPRARASPRTKAKPDLEIISGSGVLANDIRCLRDLFYCGGWMDPEVQRVRDERLVPLRLMERWLGDDGCWCEKLTPLGERCLAMRWV